MPGYGKLVFKLLELLANDFYLSLPRSREERKKFFQESEKIWHEVDRKHLFNVLKRLHLQNVIENIRERDGIERIILTNKGKARFLQYQFNNLKLSKKKKWDNKWRIIVFDVPESQRKIRDALRKKLKHLGFLEFQKSVFVYPYPCEDEINFVINFFNIYDYVYYLESSIVPDDKFKAHFGI